ncbi:arylsulfatase [Paenibacillus aquistagni]|uniref:Arylsulfatase A n=1 Tax=Paenibacillus aquistagni TaxID=1852522 RepID=A0A1X7LK69_9BACL|nr:arylsulfatase [Paenibacillus aquistagni]SMG53937.1 Arylsulfatase A [Paenibacillus aquistagni]
MLSTEARPNLLLITVDQMRYDCMSIEGHPIVDTPNLDELARTGIRFERAYSATPSCVPARAAIFTGLSQVSHGRVGYDVSVPWRYDTTLPGELARAGYHTQCVGKMHVNPTRSLLGFHNVRLHDGYTLYNRNRTRITAANHFDHADDYLPWLRERAGAEQDMLDLGLDCNASTVARPWTLPESLHPTNWVVTESIDFLRRRDTTKPFFLWMSFVRPHPPLDPPQAYWDMYAQEAMPARPIGDWADTNDPGLEGLNPVTGKGLVPKRRLDRALAGYYGLITHLDHQIGRYMQALREYGVLNNTIIMFTSDHGDMLGDHHLYRKALPYEGSAHVPFILNDPGNQLGLARGTKLQEVIEMRDIMPTLLDAAGLTIPDGIDGESILGLARGEKKDWRHYLHGEHAYGMQSNQWITDGRHKYIWYSQTGEEQLFDLLHDPTELHNAIGDEAYQEEASRLRTLLIQELNGREEGYSDGERLYAGCKPKLSLQHLLDRTN